MSRSLTHPPPPSASASDRRHAANERRAHDRHVRAVIDGMSDAFLALDADWQVTFVNREAARLSGVPAETLIGMDFWARWPEALGTELEATCRRVMREREPAELVQHYPASNRWHEVRLFPIDDGGIAIFYRDVTAQTLVEADRLRHADALAAAHAQAMEAELQFRLLVDRVRDYAVFVMDRDGIITHWGEGARRMKGYTAEEAVGQHLRFAYPSQGAAEDGTAEAHLRKAAETGEYIGEGSRVRRDGRLFDARVVLTALRRGGELVGFSKITQDLTADRRREEALVAAMAAAQAASDAKSQFLANTSHEIRTPLNAVMGYAELLEMGLAGPLSGNQQHYLGRIQETSRHLLSLINDVLDLSRIEAGQMRAAREPGLLGDAVQGALHVMEPQARGRRVTLANACSAGTPLAFDADSERVRQIVVNLLSNAVRFTEPGGRVTLRCGSVDEAPPEVEAAQDGPLVYVRVEDTGIGIAPGHLDRIWEAFVQVDGARTRKVGGSGLGLTISRHLARLMGGDVTVSSEAGVGSAFTLWLPAGELSRVPASVDAPAFPDAGADAPLHAMPHGRDTLAATVDTMQHPPAGLDDIAAGVLAETERVVAMYVARLRSDDAIPSAHDLSDEALQDHSVTFLADLAQALTVAANDGPDATAMLGDGTAIQRLIAHRHGAQRARLGWTERELRRDYEVLREEVLGGVQRRVTRGSAPEIQRATELLTLFIRAAERHALQAFARARAGQEPDTGRAG